MSKRLGGRGSRVPANGTWTIAVLTLAAAAFSISITSVVPALTTISAELEISVSAGTWIFSAYLLASGALTPLVSHLGDVRGHRVALLWTLSVFTLGAVVCAGATDLGWMITGRCVQGIGGAIVPLCLGIVRDSLEPRLRAAAISAIGATAGFGTGFGLLLGGFLTGVFGYRSIFVASSVLAGVSTVSLLLLPVEPFRRSAGDVVFDRMGAVLLTVGLVALMSGISMLASFTDRWLLLVLAVAVAVAALKMLRSRSSRVPRPIIDLAASFGSRLATVHALTLLVAAGGFPVFLLVPLVAQAGVVHGTGIGLTELETGVLLFPGCLLMMVGGATYSRLARKRGSNQLLTWSTAMVLVGLVLSAALPASVLGLVAGGYVVLMGIGLHLSSAAGTIVAHSRVGLVAETSAVNTLLRNIGNALGAQACTISVMAVDGSGVVLGHPHSLTYALPASFALAGMVICGRLGNVRDSQDGHDRK